jgi:segregation and condensation protein A
MEKEEGDKNRINQGQFYDLITGEELSWQEILYDLIKTEQLDPWDIDLSILAEKYLERIRQLEEESFFVSSKVLLACALLLRLKSDILANRFIQSLDELLYGKKEDKKYVLERIELDEDELPILIPKTPMARFKKVTLQELMSSLSKAIDTENRRIKKEIKIRQAEKSALVVMPKFNRINLKDRIIQVYSQIKLSIKKPEKVRITFSEIAPSREEKLSSFLPVLHLSNQERLYLEQHKHYDEIFMMLEKIHLTIRQDENLEEEQWPEDKIIREDAEESQEFKGFKDALADLDNLEQ